MLDVTPLPLTSQLREDLDGLLRSPDAEATLRASEDARFLATVVEVTEPDSAAHPIARDRLAALVRLEAIRVARRGFCDEVKGLR
jgi:hypothetical protein